MRVTAETKANTRQRLLEVARSLFAEPGFDATTTRDVAGAAGVATGTLFNYFRSKDALAAEIVAEALEPGVEAEDDAMGFETVEEALFAHIMAGLRRLEPYRTFAGRLFDTALSPFVASDADDAATRLRTSHLERVNTIIAYHNGRGVDAQSTPVAMHLYWSLYVGVLAFWARDNSPNQEDTLALLDQSMRLFGRAMPSLESPSEGANVTDSG